MLEKVLIFYDKKERKIQYLFNIKKKNKLIKKKKKKKKKKYFQPAKHNSNNKLFTHQSH
jgi:hypothetical protein